jgi:eukaryotic translation initiation factor 2C
MCSQYLQVKNNELPQIRNAFLVAAKDYRLASAPKCKLTAVVVAKRHHVRFFPQPTEAMPNGNCRPGTLVDTAVSSPYFQDYYLQSHHGLKGTAKPAHYFLLVNEMGLTETVLQTFVCG